MSIVAYARVSTEKQSLQRQIALFDRVLGSDKYDLYTDFGISGSLPFLEREGGRKMMDAVMEGDVTEVHFPSIDRCGRRISDILTLIYGFADLGIQVVIHDQSLRLLADDGTLNPTASLVLNVLASVSQIERNLIATRTKLGVQHAKAQGKYLGRKPNSRETAEKFLAKPKTKKVLQLVREDYPTKYIAKLLEVSPQLVRKVKRLEIAMS